jgi:DNA-binding YbaB/EbfC family protein
MAKGYNRMPQAAGGGGGAGMMNQLKKMQEQLAVAQAKLADETVSGTSGGGAVKITVTGDQRCTAVQIDPEFLKDADAEMLQDMLLTAFNQAIDASKNLQNDRLGPLAGGLSGLGF